MEQTQHENSEAIQDFLFWIKQKKELGTRGPSTSVEYPFISNANIDEFFGEAKIGRILRALFPDAHTYANKSIISKKYRKIFCILLSIGKGKFIENFIKHESLDDSKLPFQGEPAGFPQSHDGLFEKFSEAQWMFHAAVFEPQRINLCLCPENILPIIKIENIKDGEGHSAVVRKVILHKAHHSPPNWNMNRTNQPAGTFALKTYHPHNAARNYEKEYKAFATLMRNKESTPGLIGFYGSFVQGDTYNLLLEFADQGTLEDYFQNVGPPYKLDDITDFWSGLFGVAQALVQIHGEVERTHGSSQIFQGWHQDIKPANILVVSGDRDSKYACQFKLGDLGQSHFRARTQSGNLLPDKDSHGTRTYGAPECYRGNDFTHSVPLSVHTSVDIWSFGCVCSEAAVWVVRGKGALSDYRELRRQATSGIPGFEDNGCFHNGSEVLDCVRETLQDLNLSLRKDDVVTPEILRLIDDMLTLEGSRLTSKQVWDKLDRCLKRKGSVVGSVGWPEHGPYPFMQSEFSPTTTHPMPNNLASPRTLLLSDQQIRQQDPRSRPNSYAAASRNSMAMGDGTGSMYQQRQLHPQQRLRLRIRSEDSTMRLSGGLQESSADMSSEEDLPNSHPIAPTEAPPVVHEETLRPFNRSDTITQTTKLSCMSVMSAVHWRESKKRKSFLSRGKFPLGGKQNFMDHLQGRDQVFLVDDSALMERHQGDLAGLLGLLAFIVKGSDDDGIDVYFTGPNTEVHTKNYDGIIEGIEAIKYSGNPGMAPALDKILKRFLQDFSTRPRGFFKGLGSKSPKPMTCYILTDGNWPDREAVEQQLKDFVGRLQEIDIAEKGKFGIQFITFGFDEDAARFFRRLDSELDLDPDIVDAEPSNGNVWKMLFGSIKGHWDNDKGNHMNTLPLNHVPQSNHLRNVPHGSQDSPPTGPIPHRQTSIF